MRSVPGRTAPKPKYNPRMSDCIFCKIATGEIRVGAVFQDDQCIVFPDIDPKAPTHLLVIPRQHFATAAHAPEPILGHLVTTATSVAKEKLPNGYRIVINTGDDGGQTVHHLHLHLLGGRTMHWPPG